MFHFMSRYFLADVHLSPARPDITQAFQSQLSALDDVEALYLLGDVFDAYLGDGAMTAFQAQIADFLKDLPYRIYVQHGNRDFLIGKRFAQRAGVTLLPDLHFLLLNQQRILLMHGDLLCTQDVAYQRFRRFAHHRWTKSLFQALPDRWQQALARHLRGQSQHKPRQIMDVDATTVEALFRHHRLDVLIHGHTHRPACHQEALGTRWVLPDWQGFTPLLRYQNGAFSLFPSPKK